MRSSRVTAQPVQLALPDPEMTDPVERWWALPEPTRTHVLTLLARLVTRAVLVEQGDPVAGASDE